ncbi:MAG: flagellar protein [Clostridium sp.]|nr:flagellar protein [Clostridium sp.]
MDRLQNSFVSIEQMKDTYLTNYKAERQAEKKAAVSFEEMLIKASEQSVSNEVTFSKHANDRLASRNINLNDEQMERLHNGIRQAKEKSIKESLVMMDNIAFIVNIKNNTVITAMDQDTNDSNVFTNIDGAVIV